MGEVDFYVVSDGSQQALGRVACRIAEKAFARGHKVYLLTDCAEASAALDDLMWTFRQQSFLPHARIDSGAHDQAPILIGERDDLPAGTDVLINLTISVPECAAGCARIADLVAGEAEARRAGRDRYRHYRDAGAVLRSHEVSP